LRKILTEISCSDARRVRDGSNHRRWFKKAATPSRMDEPLVELETDKVTIECRAISSVLGEIAKDGETVAVGALLGQINEGGAASAAKPVPHLPRLSRAAPAAGLLRLRRLKQRCAAGAVGSQALPRKPHRCRDRPRFSKDGRVTKGRHAGRDREGGVRTDAGQSPRASVQVRAPSPADDRAAIERVKMTRLRQTIARRLKERCRTRPRC